MGHNNKDWICGINNKDIIIKTDWKKSLIGA